jgi:hypothetical protein
LSAQVVSAFVISSFVTKGGLLYTVLNWAAVAAILALIGTAAHFCHNRRRPDQQYPAHIPVTATTTGNQR